MPLDDRILDCLRRFGPSLASEVAARLGLGEHDVKLRLGLMLGSEVAVSAGVWRLLDLPAATRLSNMSRSVCGLVKGLTAQAGR